MRRGTTPTHYFDTSIDLTPAEVIWLTYEQDECIVMNKTKEDLEVTPEQICVTLTQKETLAFKERGAVKIQARVRFPNEKAVASNIITTDVERILKGGEI